MPPTDVSVVSRWLLSDFFTERTISRGRNYWRVGKVHGIEWEDEGIIASVAGSEVYAVEIPYVDEPPVHIVVADHEFDIDLARCTCPVGAACKHIVAVVLEMTEGPASGAGSTTTRRAAGVRRGSGSPVATLNHGANVLLKAGLASSHKPVTAPAWKAFLGPYVPRSLAKEPGMALMFEVTWPSAAKKGAAPFLRVRPAVRSNSLITPWARSQVSWTSHWAIKGEEASWLQRFGDSYRAMNRESGYSYSSLPDWITLERMDMRVAWEHLVAAHEMGIPFVYERPKVPVVVIPKAFGIIGHVTSAPRGGLTLEFSLKGGDILDDATNVIEWGSPVVALTGLTAEGEGRVSSLVMAGFSFPVPTPVVQAVLSATPLVIPPSDVSSFVGDVYPRLIRDMEIVASDGVTLPRPAVPQLHLGVRKLDELGVEIVPQFRYVTNDGDHYIVPFDASTHASKDVIRDSYAEGRAKIVAGRFLDSVHPELADAFQSGQPVCLTGIPAARFVDDVIPRVANLMRDNGDLAQENTPVVEVMGELPSFEELLDDPLLEVGAATTQASTDMDWFDLDVQMTVAGRAIPIPELMQSLASAETHLMLEDGSYFRLDHPTIVRLRALMQEAQELEDKPGTGLSVSRYQASWWQELVALGVVNEQAQAWHDTITRLLTVKDLPPLTLPSSLQATLRPYQHEGATWLSFLYDHRLGGILADDMGLGKTVQTIALFVHVREQEAAGVSARLVDGRALASTNARRGTGAKSRRGTKALAPPLTNVEPRPFLVVAPTSVAANWMSELQRFSPSLACVHIDTTCEKAQQTWGARIAGADVVVTSYGIMRIDEAEFASQQWDVVVFDEAQAIKSYQSKGYQVARSLSAATKLVLTGTPLENNLMELWALLSIAAPGLYPSPKRFQSVYQRPIERGEAPERMERFRRRIRPLMMRRTKELVVSDLPPKIDQVVNVELVPAHRKVYDTHLARERQRILRLLKDLDHNQIEVLAAITRMRQLSIAPALVDPVKYRKVPSTKLDYVIEQIEKVIQEGHRALVFSQFTSFHAMVRAQLDEREIRYSYLDGKTTKRKKVIDAFRTSDIPLFLISLKAGGVGLNLAEADYCFLLDPWWNPAVEEQAIDRAHRIGQTRTVMVQRLVCKGTIEEKVMALKKRKAELFASVMEEGEFFSTALTGSDIRALFDI